MAHLSLPLSRLEGLPLIYKMETVVMDLTSSVFARHSWAVLSAGLFLAVGSTGALSNEKCRQLEDLSRQYAGVELTSAQQQLKHNLVAWYHRNCGVRRAAARDCRYPTSEQSLSFSDDANKCLRN